MGGRGASSTNTKNTGYVGDSSIGLSNLEKMKPFYRKGSRNYKSAPYLMNTPLRNDGHIVDANTLNMSIKGPDRNGGKVTTVNVDSLHSTQQWVDARGVKAILSGKSGHGYSSDMPVAVRTHGETWIVDGNHRAAAAKLSGKKKIKVRIIG